MNKVVPICLLVVIGLLSLCALPGAKVSAQNVDPTVMGPLVVTYEEYDRKDGEFRPTDLNTTVKLSGVVHYPVNWTGAPMPLIVFIHGKHETCYVKATETPNDNHWPCVTGEAIIPSHRGFDYIASVLASYGYIVVSINANAINAQESASRLTSTQARVELIQKHLELWNRINTTDDIDFRTRFNGKIDMNRIGLMGHSAGGESVIRYAMKPPPPPAPRFAIKAVFVIASPDPTQTDTDQRLRINDIPFALLTPYCDGDVGSLEGVHFYDDSRYNLSTDKAPKHMILVLGANHNFYNKVWTPQMPPEFTYPGAEDDLAGMDDSYCNPNSGKRLTAKDQRTTAIAYVCAFMRAYVGGEPQFLPLLTGAAPPPPSIERDRIHVSFHAPDDIFLRKDINRLLTNQDLDTNRLGGKVIRDSLLHYYLCLGASPETRCLSHGLSPDAEPHVLDPRKNRNDPGGLSQLQIGWSKPSGVLINEIPPLHGDVSRFQALQFRASVNFDDKDGKNIPLSPSNVAFQDFRVVLRDATGTAASVNVSDFSRALFYPPGDDKSPQRVILNTVRLPLSAFVGVNLTAIRAVEFRFDQQPRGSLLITDLAFAAEPRLLLPVFTHNACLKDESNGSELVFNTITGNYTFCIAGGPTISGVGRVMSQASTISLAQGENEIDRRVTVTMDTNAKRGTASLQLFNGSPVYTITDRNTANSTCSCAPEP